MPRLSASIVLLFACASLAAQISDPAKMFRQAAAAQRTGDNATAIRIYRQLLIAYPESIELHANLGAALANVGQFDGAIDQYHKVLALDPNNLSVRLNLALAYEQKRDTDSAVRELQIVHHRDPTNMQGAMLLGECYYNLQRFPELVSLLSPLESSMPDNLDLKWLLGSALIRTGHAEEGLRRVGAVAEKSRSADAYLLAGQTRLDRSEYGLALSDVNNALAINPSLAGGQTLRGMILEQTGEYDQAEAALQAGLKADEQDFNANYYLGAISFYRRVLTDARNHLERALQVRSNSSEARYELALVFKAEGDLGAARLNLEIVEKQSPDWIKPHIELAALYYQLRLPEDGAREREIVDHLTALQLAKPAQPSQ
jgi:Flp pilus assembly protein TadD